MGDGGWGRAENYRCHSGAKLRSPCGAVAALLGVTERAAAPHRVTERAGAPHKGTERAAADRGVIRRAAVTGAGTDPHTLSPGGALGRLGRALGPVLVAAGICAAPLQAQSPADAASPLLAPEHWSVRAAERAEALGLAPEYLPAQRAVPRAAVAAALEAARSTALVDGARPEVVALADGWYLRFVEEFPEYAPRAEGGATAIDMAISPRSGLLGSHLELGLASRAGAAGPGLHEFTPDRTGAEALSNRTQALAAGELAFGIGGWAAASLSPVIGADATAIDRAELVLRWGRLRASVGRAEVGWATGRGGGVLFSGTVPLDRVELATATPVRLPSLLRLLGPFAIQAFAGPLPGDRHPGSPWLLGSTASARPHPRFTLSGHRAIMLGGDGVEEKMGLDEVLPALIGKNIPGANQIASTSFRVRLPTEALLPISVYCEWGAEDSAGAPFDAPGLVCGGTSPALPGVPALALGLEHAQFGVRPVNGPPWYRHHKFPGNWAMDEAPLGHPLGGEGRQWLVYSDLTLLEGRLSVDGSAFRRVRTGENLYIPGREGVSLGGRVAARWRVSSRAEARVAAAREDGEGWAETRAWLGGRVLF